MSKKPIFTTIPFETNLTDRLKDPEYAVIFINTILKDTDSKGQERFLEALNLIAKAYGLSSIAKQSKLQRESIRKALSEKGNPRLSTLFALLRSFGLKMQLQSTQPEKKVTRKQISEQHQHNLPATKEDIAALSEQIQNLSSERTAKEIVSSNPKSDSYSDNMNKIGSIISSDLAISSGANKYAH